MRIAYNPTSAAPLSGAPSGDYLNAITFDLAGHNIFARGEMFKGTDTTYDVFKKHASDNAGGYNGLVPAPSYNGGSVARFLREDGTWVSLVSNSYRSIAINDTTILNNEDTQSLNLSSSGSIILNPVKDSNSKYTGKVVISADNATQSQSGFMSAADKTKLDNMTFTPGDGFSGTLADAFTTITALGNSITAVAGKQTATFVSGTGINVSVNTTDYSVVIEGAAMVGATSEQDGQSGLVPQPTKSDSRKFLRGDGTWQIAEDTKVTQTNTTDSKEYRILFSKTADDTTRTEGSRKSSKLKFNPSSGILTANSFIGNLDGSYVNALTGYTKANAIGAISSTDSLNSALGKLEFKTDFIYNDLFGTDSDDIINKWSEIVSFIDSIKEGTDITDEFVTRKTGQTIIGEKIFSGTSEAILTVDRESTNPTWIKFLNNGNLAGYIGVNTNKIPQFNNGTSTYDLLHTGNAGDIFEILENDNNQLSVTIGGVNKKVTVNYALTVGNLSGGTPGSIVFLLSEGTTSFVEAPEINNMVLKFDTARGCPYWASDDNYDYRVYNELSTETKAFITGTTSSTSNTGTQIFDTGVYLGNSPGTLHATLFVGDVDGSVSKLGTTDLGTKIKPIYLVGGVPTECNPYAGGTSLTLNGTDASGSTASIYAPTSGGTSGFILKSNGTSAPTWVSIDSLGIKGGGYIGTTEVQKESAAQALTGITNLTMTGTLTVGGTGDFTDGILKVLTINAPTSSNSSTYGAGTSGQVLTSNGTSVYWKNIESNSYRPISINNTSILGNTNSNALNLVAGDNITLTPESGNTGKVVIGAIDTTYTLSGALSDNKFITTLTPSSGSATHATIPAMGGASSSAAGTAGLVPAPAKNKLYSFLRGDGSWVAVNDTWRAIQVNGTLLVGTGTDTYAINYAAGTGIALVTTAGTSSAANKITIYNSGVISIAVGTDTNANKLAINTGGSTSYLTVPYATRASNLLGGAKGNIIYLSEADTTAFLANPTTNGYVLKFNTSTGLPYWAADNNSNSWRAILVNSTQLAGTGTGTYALNFVAGDGIILDSTVGTSSAANKIIINNSGVRGVTLGTGDNVNKLAVNTGGTTNYLTIPYAVLSTEVICTEATDNKYRPIVLTNTENKLYYTSKIIANYSTGDLKLNSLLNNGVLSMLGDTASTAHIQFTRTGYNYITVPSGGTLAFSVTGTTSGAGTLVKLSSQGFTPESTGIVSLGTSALRWSNIFSALGTFSGEVYASSFYENSDINLKDNILNILSSDNIPTVKRFNWKSDGTTSYGFIAQELEDQGYSELVSTNNEGIKTVNYSAALSLTIAKLQAKIAELENQIKKLI